MSFDEDRIGAVGKLWTPGATRRNGAVLEPGRYAYRMRSKTWLPIEGVVEVRPVEGVVEVRPGVTTPLTVELSPR